MATEQQALLRVIRMMAGQHDLQASDRDLLQRFSERRDEDAFAVLVRRHGAMVLGVAQRVLGHYQDAEDVCQGAFLLLARKAGTVAWRDSVANWLYGVAYHLALKRRDAAYRRNLREANAQAQAPPDPLADVTLRDLQAVLDEELSRLPRQYRMPLVLCCLEGRTRDEAAGCLGLPLGVVKSRLEEGRALLRRRLARRGLSLSAALAGSTLFPGAARAAVAEALVRSTSRAALLIPGGIQTSWPVKLKIASAFLLAVLLGAVAVGMQTDRTQAKADSQGDQRVKPGEKTRTITGKVIGADGKPIVAALHLAWVEGKSLPLGETNADGTFRVSVPLKYRDRGGWLVASAAGHGADFQAHGMDGVRQSLTASAEVTLRLPKERPIRGRILDQQGKPVSGASVEAASVGAFDGEAEARLKRQFADPLANLFGSPPHGDRSMWFADQPAHATTTDAAGRFEIRGVGEGQLVTLRIRAAGIADTDILTHNRDGFDPAPINKAGRHNRRMGTMYGGQETWHLHGADPVVVAEPEKVVRGTVTDHGGRPRPGVRVTFTRSTRDDFQHPRKWAVTGKDGRYEIRGARRHTGYMVECPPDAEAGLLPCQAFAQDTMGAEPVLIDLKCAKGVVVTGVVKDRATGNPVPARLDVEVLSHNPFVKHYPPFLYPSAVASERFRTDKDGRFRVVTIPGPVLLMAAPTDGWERFQPARADPKYPTYFSPNEGGGLMFHKYSIDGRAVRGFVRAAWCRVIDLKATDTLVTLDAELEGR